MKTIFKSIIFFTAAMACLLSCQAEVAPSMNNETEEFVYTFALSNVETKAYLDEDVARWESGDQLGVYTVGTPGTSYNRFANIDVTKNPVEFNVSSYYALTEGDNVYCYFPYISSNSQDPTTVTLTIPTAQNGKMNAMPMVGIPYTMEAAVEAKTNEPIADINLMNLGGVFQFRVFSTNESYRTETIQSVKFTANSAVAGSFVFNITQVEDLSISGYEDKQITVSQNVAVGTSKDAAGIINMVVAPGTYSGSLEVVTSAATYTFNLSSAKTVERAHIKPLNVDLANGVREIPVAYDKVSSLSDIVPGEYIILASKDGAYYTMKNAEVAAKGLVACSFSGTGLVMSENQIKGNAPEYTWTFTGSNAAMTIKSTSAPSAYLYATATNNGMVVGKTSDTWKFIAVDGGFNMQDKNQSRYLCLYETQDWRCYSNTDNGQPILSLYKKHDDRTILAEPEAIAIDNVIEWDAVANADSYTLKIGGNELAGITGTSYTFSNDDFSLEAGYYDASIMAVSNNSESFINSGYADVDGKIKVGTPTLPKPVLAKDVVNSSDVTIKWTADAMATAGYSCSINLPGTTPVIVNGGSVKFENLAPETEYTISVYAVATTGECAYAQSETATITITTKAEAGEFPVTASWSYSSGATTGFTYSKTLGANKSGYVQDNSSSEGIELNLKKSDNSAFFTSVPKSISFTAKVGGGSAKNPLSKNVYVHLIDNNGEIIDGTTTVVTTKVTNTTGSEFTVTVPTVGNVYGVRLTHEKESGYNVRIYSFSITATDE